MIWEAGPIPHEAISSGAVRLSQENRHGASCVHDSVDQLPAPYKTVDVDTSRVLESPFKQR